MKQGQAKVGNGGNAAEVNAGRCGLHTGKE